MFSDGVLISVRFDLKKLTVQLRYTTETRGCPKTFSILCLLCSEESRNMNQLDDFMECLAKFTRYNSVRPLATLSYASDLYNGSSIVSR